MSDEDQMPVIRSAHGFKFGAVDVRAIAQHKGHAYVQITTAKETLQIRITPSGLIRVARQMDVE